MPKLLLVFSLFFTLTVSAQEKLVKRELRGAWITTAFNIDWPVKGQSPQQQKDAFISLIDRLKANGVNVVYGQVRSESDAMYKSDIEPWSAALTGTQGVAPSPFWDPLQFMIDECRKRNIEFHAWLNPYRAASSSQSIPGFSANHVTKKHPEWLLESGLLRILNPGLSEVRNHVKGVVNEILDKYDVDGIHFDDYFYPNANVNDASTFAAYPRGFTNIDDWRRDNVNLMVKDIHDLINQKKPYVKFGISPSGIYRNSTNPAIGSNTTGLQHYSANFADSKKWLQEEWIDYLIPQVYWHIGQAGADYSIVVPWWNNNAFNRHIYIGLAGYKVNDASLNQQPWLSNKQIPDQIRLNRKNANVLGQVVFSTKDILNNKLNFADSMRVRFYQKPALLPKMAWKDNVAPQAPVNLQVFAVSANKISVSWGAPALTNATEFDKIRSYVLYRAEMGNIDIEDPKNILTVLPSTVLTYEDNITDPTITYYYKVTALDRFHNESVPTQEKTSIPEKVSDFVATQSADKILVRWKSLSEGDVSKFDLYYAAGDGAFSLFKTVNKQANNNTSNNYEVEHTDPVLGRNRFKLVRTATDQTTRDYEGVEVNFIAPEIVRDLVVKQEGDEVLTSWKTTHEKYHQKFILERTVNGVDYTLLKEFIKTDDTGKSYSFVDEQPLKGRSFYRLRQQLIDFGIRNIDRIEVNINNDVEQVEKPVLYPNPHLGDFTVYLPEFNDNSVEIQVLTIDGKRVYSKKHALGEDRLTELKLKGKLSRGGIYYVIVQGATNRKVIKTIAN